MVHINSVLKTVDRNKNLTKEVKENIKHLLIIYENQIDNIDLNTINAKMADLSVKEGSKFLLDAPLKYNEKDKTIYININDTKNDYDYKYLLMREIMLIQTYKDEKYNQRQNYFGPIYEGFASICASNLVGNDGLTCPYEEEMVVVNLLGNIVGYDCIEQLFVKNDSKLLIDKLSAFGCTIDDITEITNIINYNKSIRSNSRARSMLGEIQSNLIKIFANKENHSKKDVITFKTLLVSNPKLFSNPEMYKNINNVYNEFDKTMLNYSFTDGISSKKR